MMAEGKNKLKKYVPKKSDGWRYALLNSFKKPDMKVLEDNEVIVIKDLYPKASYHFLVCPKENIENLKSVKPKHIPLLKHMQKIAEKISEEYREKKFLIGYHAIPTMARLHLHVISDDFNSSYLKTKRHWNSFNTEYFIPSSVIIKQFEGGKVKYVTKSEGEQFLKKPLKCHKCDYYPTTMPNLKEHILKHFETRKEVFTEEAAQHGSG